VSQRCFVQTLLYHPLEPSPLYARYDIPALRLYVEGPLNRAGVVMKLGNGATYYCGRTLGAEVIPGSDGTCGPTVGPQCPDCVSAQATLAGQPVNRVGESGGWPGSHTSPRRVPLISAVVMLSCYLPFPFPLPWVQASP
jgi:hypothetical protein